MHFYFVLLFRFKFFILYQLDRINSSIDRLQFLIKVDFRDFPEYFLESGKINSSVILVLKAPHF